jgi:hypothetical protein
MGHLQALKKSVILFPNPNPHPMELMMYLGNDLIESVPIRLDQLSQPGYLGKYKRVLKEKHAQLISESCTGPEFLVIDLCPQTTNQTNTSKP